MATTAAARFLSHQRKRPTRAADLPVYNRLVRNCADEREVAVRSRDYQQCGGGRRVIRKAIGAS